MNGKYMEKFEQLRYVAQHFTRRRNADKEYFSIYMEKFEQLRYVVQHLT